MHLPFVNLTRFLPNEDLDGKHSDDHDDDHFQVRAYLHEI